MLDLIIRKMNENLNEVYWVNKEYDEKERQLQQERETAILRLMASNEFLMEIVEELEYTNIKKILSAKKQELRKVLNSDGRTSEEQRIAHIKYDTILELERE